MSAGGQVGFARDEMGPPTVEIFRLVREVRPSRPHWRGPVVVRRQGISGDAVARHDVARL